MTRVAEKINPALAYEKLADLEASDDTEAFHSFTLGFSLSASASQLPWLPPIPVEALEECSEQSKLSSLKLQRTSVKYQ